MMLMKRLAIACAAIAGIVAPATMLLNTQDVSAASSNVWAHVCFMSGGRAATGIEVQASYYDFGKARWIQVWSGNTGASSCKDVYVSTGFYWHFFGRRMDGPYLRSGVDGYSGYLQAQNLNLNFGWVNLQPCDDPTPGLGLRSLSGRTCYGDFAS
jgi:hypothetical protein